MYGAGEGFLQDDVKLYCQHISKSSTKASSCVCKYYSSKCKIHIVHTCNFLLVCVLDVLELVYPMI